VIAVGPEILAHEQLNRDWYWHGHRYPVVQKHFGVIQSVAIALAG
jgi:hypothetical protein